MPDLSPERQHAEAVAYGKLLGVREVLDELRRHYPNPNFKHDPEYVRGFREAIEAVKRTRLGVEVVHK